MADDFDITRKTRSFWPAFYYNFTGDIDSTASKENAANYTRVEIRSGQMLPSTGSANRSDCAAAPNCTYDEEIQNFANWYTYYRSRILLARAGVGRAFAEQGTGLRVGFAAINKGSATDRQRQQPGCAHQGVRKFTGSDRSAFFDSLYEHEIPTSEYPAAARAGRCGAVLFTHRQQRALGRIAGYQQYHRASRLPPELQYSDDGRLLELDGGTHQWRRQCRQRKRSHHHRAGQPVVPVHTGQSLPGAECRQQPAEQYPGRRGHVLLEPGPAHGSRQPGPHQSGG